MDFKYWDKDIMKKYIETNVICFMNTFKMINDSPAMRACVYANVDNLRTALEFNREETVKTIVETLCYSNDIYDKSANTILNLQHYTGTHALPHHLNYKNGVPVLTYLFPLQYNLIQEGDTFHYEIVKGLRY